MSRRRVAACRAQLALFTIALLMPAGCARTRPTAPTPGGPDPDEFAEPAIVALNGMDLALEATPWDPSDELLPVEFGWEAPCRVPARQEVTRRGGNDRTATLTFDLLVERRGDEGDDLAVRLDQMKFVAFDGKDASDPMFTGPSSPLQALMSATPTVIVTYDGDYVGVEGVDATADAVLPVVAGGAPATVKSPAGLALIENAARAQWDHWVGVWLDWEVPPGEPAVINGPAEAAPGVTVPRTLTLETLGRVRGAPSLLLLRFRVVVEGPEAVRATSALAQRLAEQAGAQATVEAPVEQLRRDQTVTVAIDPKTAYPYRVRTETITETDGDRQVEIRDTAFDWSRAVGCMVP